MLVSGLRCRHDVTAYIFPTLNICKFLRSYKTSAEKCCFFNETLNSMPQASLKVVFFFDVIQADHVHACECVNGFP